MLLVQPRRFDHMNLFTMTYIQLCSLHTMQSHCFTCVHVFHAIKLDHCTILVAQKIKRRIVQFIKVSGKVPTNQRA